MIKAIWLDDEREPGRFLYEDFGYSDKEIFVCKTYKEFIKQITNNGLPKIICFDHDLGGEKTGYDAAKYVVNYCLKNKQKLPSWYIQSANIVGALNIDGLFKNFCKEYPELGVEI